jgi:glycosyltransferase involved in cell wall biosynthesis
MATRRPIVTAPVGENLEALAELGYYYDPGSDDSLGCALIRALTLESEIPYKLEAHTWSVRTEMFAQWVEKEFS